MSRTTHRLAAVTAMATAGFFWTAPLFSPRAAADLGSPGVPCVNIIQQAAANPPNLQEGIPGAASSLFPNNPPVAGGPVPPATAPGAIHVPPASVPGAPGTHAPAAAAVPPMGADRPIRSIRIS